MWKWVEISTLLVALMVPLFIIVTRRREASRPLAIRQLARPPGFVVRPLSPRRVSP